MSDNPVAIAALLTSCSKVKTLGIRASLGEYPRADRDAILGANRIFFPTPKFVRIFEAVGKATFPSGISYTLRRSRLVQEALLQILKCPHLLTRSYFGRQKTRICSEFRFPFHVMCREPSRPRVTVTNGDELISLAATLNPLIVREIPSYENRFFITLVNFAATAVKRCGAENANGAGDLEAWKALRRSDMGEHVLLKLEDLARRAGLNDIAVEVGIDGCGWQAIEFARPAVAWMSPKGPVNRHEYIARLIESGEL
ncbi:MAG: hypothetical protein LLG06_01500 [Desulfobacteraceae bacterium]|nr:hypothetical protein [Desulfobacteraceae bacterium]